MKTNRPQDGLPGSSESGISPESPSIRERASDDTVAPKPPLWFLQDVLDENDLMPQQLAALRDLIEPLYKRLVLSEEDELLRATANAIVFTTMLETLMQPEVITAMRAAIRDPDHKRAAFDKVFHRFLEATRERHKATDLHLRLRRAKHARWSRPADRHGLIHEHGVGI